MSCGSAIELGCSSVGLGSYSLRLLSTRESNLELVFHLNQNLLASESQKQRERDAAYIYIYIYIYIFFFEKIYFLFIYFSFNAPRQGRRYTSFLCCSCRFFCCCWLVGWLVDCLVGCWLLAVACVARATLRAPKEDELAKVNLNQAFWDSNFNKTLLFRMFCNARTENTGIYIFLTQCMHKTIVNSDELKHFHNPIPNAKIASALEITAFLLSNFWQKCKI